MTDKNDDKAKGAGGKRPFATIELQATEIKTAPAAGIGTSPQQDTAKPSASEAGAKPAPARSNAGETGGAAKPATTPADKSTGRTPVLGYVAAGVCGGIASLLAAALGAPWLFAPGTNDDLVRRISALESGPAATVGTFEQKFGEMNRRLAAREEDHRSLAAAHAVTADAAKSAAERIARQETDGEFVNRLARFEEQLSTLAAAAGTDPKTAPRIPQLAQVVTKLGELEGRLPALKREISQEIEQRAAAIGNQAEAGRALLGQRAQSLEQSLRSITEDAASLRTAVDAMKADFDARLRAVTRPADLAAAVGPITGRLAEIDRNLQNVVKSEQDRNATAGNILLSLELANLKRALDRDGRYAAELAAVKRLSGDKLDLRALEAQQSAGVPSIATLHQELRSAAHAMIDAEAEVPDASLTDRMLAGVKSVVRVRRTNLSADDTSAEAVIGRMETFLKEGLLAEALAEARKLSAKSAAPAKGLIARIEGRHAIEKALVELESSLKTSLASGAEPRKGTN